MVDLKRGTVSADGKRRWTLQEDETLRQLFKQYPTQWKVSRVACTGCGGTMHM